MEGFTTLAGHLLLARLLLVAGLGTIAGYAGSQSYGETMGIPGALLPLVTGPEIGAALELILGWPTRLVAFALAGFSNEMQTILLMKHLAIAGGLLLVTAQDPVSSLGLKRRRLATAGARARTSHV